MNERQSHRLLGRALALMPVLLGTGVAFGQAPTFEVTKVADVITGYGTFQSHNQKIVQNQYGTFMTYIYSQNSSSFGTWRLARSIDGGRSWGTIYRSYTPTNAPTLDTDEHGSLYLVHGDYSGSTLNATFLRFYPEKGFRNPLVRTIANGSSGKYASHYDPWRKRLYYVTAHTCESATSCTYPSFYALDLNGNVLFTRGINLAGPYAYLQYPHLEMGSTTLYYAWTSVPLSGYLYPSIHYVYSEDGGNSWRAPGSLGYLSLPIADDWTGPSRMVSLLEDVSYHNWLSSFIYKGDYLHFGYLTQRTPSQQRYMRFSPGGGVRDIHLQPNWTGNTLSIRQLDGFFASEPGYAPLFMNGQLAGPEQKVAILKTIDLGVSWQDHAVSARTVPSPYALYSLSGNRQLTKAGDILGMYTQTATNDHSVWFYRAPGVDRSSDPFAHWVFFHITGQSIPQPELGRAYIVPLTVRHGGDSNQNGTYSRLRLFENGTELGPAHSQHADIRTYGAGRFSHWHNYLYFSSSDNSDPRTNGRWYSVAVPWTEVSGPVFYGRLDPGAINAELGHAYIVGGQDLGARGDTAEQPTISRLRLYEDGIEIGPAHSQHQDIRSSGQGAYSHWYGQLYFSASDNTDPRTNGRSYTWAIERASVTPCGTLHVENAFHEIGYAYVLQRSFGLPTDSNSSPTASPVRLFENGVELTPAHSIHQFIRDSGAGRFSDWNGGWIYFSASDNSDPRTNGRIYTWGSSTGCP